MPQRIEFEGQIHEFPDDFTDADIAAALGGESSAKATPPPPSATIGMLAQSTATGDPKQRRPVDDVQDVLKWGGRVIGNAFGMGAPGEVSPINDALEHPGMTLASGVIGLAAPKVPGIVAKGLGISRENAGKNMQAALEAGRDLRVPLNEGANDAAMRARELVGSRNSELNAFFDRLTNPKVTQYRGDDMAVREAQDFVSKFGAMSADDAAKIPPMARKEIAKLTDELRAALTGTLDTVGKGAQYTKGVNEYRRSKQAADIWEAAKPWLRKMGYAAAAGAGYKGINSVTSQ